MGDIFRTVLFGILVTLPFAGRLLAASVEEGFKDLTVNIPVSMKGWSGGQPKGGPVITFPVRGISYPASKNGDISSSYTWPVKPAPTPAEAKSDPFRLVRYSVFLRQDGNRAAFMKLIDPAGDPKIVAVFNRPDVVASDKTLLVQVNGGGFLFAFQQPDGTLSIFYYLQQPSRRVVQCDTVRQVNGSYCFAARPPDWNDMRTPNFFTALYDTVGGLSHDLWITP